jgi:hypothetical protein
MRKITIAIRLGLAVTAFLVSGSIATAQEQPTAPAHGDRGAKPADGVRIHGHWTIDIRNPDGTLASHNEFENALTPFGAGGLSNLLSASGFSFGFWTLQLAGANFRGPCMQDFNGTSLHSVCDIVPAGNPDLDPSILPDRIFPTLEFRQVKTAPELNFFDAVEVTGNVTAFFDDPITQVISKIYYSGSHGFTDFSQRTLATPINVVAGQKIYVKVVFSFS